MPNPKYKCCDQTQYLLICHNSRNSKTDELRLLLICICNKENLVGPQRYQVTRFNPVHCNSNIAKTDNLLPPTMTLIHCQWSARQLSILKPALIDPSILAVIKFCLLLFGIIACHLLIIAHFFHISTHLFCVGIKTAVSYVPRHTNAAFPILAGSILLKPVALFQKCIAVEEPTSTSMVQLLVQYRTCTNNQTGYSFAVCHADYRFLH